MSLLPSEIKSAIRTFTRDDEVLTDFDIAQLSHDKVFDLMGEHSDIFRKAKSIAFQDSQTFFVQASSIQPHDPVSTSIDYLFGEPFYPQEITSIEGASGTGKTRISISAAHEFALSGHVLYIDSDFKLTQPIIRAIQESLNLPDVETLFDLTTASKSSGSITFIPASTIGELYETINSFIESRKPALIVIDSILSLLMRLMHENGPGHALLEELATELKHIAYKTGAHIIVTNGTKSSESNKPFLGQQYAYLFHRRLRLLSTRFYVSKCDLLTSPRIPFHSVTIYLHNLKEVLADDSTLLDEQFTSSF